MGTYDMVQEDVSSRASFMIHTTDNRQKAMHMSPPVQFHGGLKNRAPACPWSLTGMVDFSITLY